MGCTCSSESCALSTAPGADVSRQLALAVFGNAMTSLIDLAPARSITSLSRPSAIPPCGGAPMSKHSMRYPNLSSASSLLRPMASKTRSCTSLRKILSEPPPTSTPLYTRSYATAVAPSREAPGSRLSGLGAVKGWCSASSLPSSSFHSNIGKSVTHSTSCFVSSTSPSMRAAALRTRSSALLTTGSASAAMSRRSPGCAPPHSSSSAASRPAMPSTTGFAPSSVAPSSATRRNASPPAPAATASLHSSPLGGLSLAFAIRPPSGTRQHFTTPPASTAFENTAKPHPRAASVTSYSSRPNLRSGLSEPYDPIASAYDMRRNGLGRSTPAASLNAAAVSSSARSMMASCGANATSMSSCVNSGCLSALRSSSRKHRATW
mmetsp:Transcript_6209/g.21831  ORF Transcript_6209/g.21831 Transcript_6209/m.21831 type:complete len:378 (+) Transcript_6209:175-1308(+)